MKRNKKVFNFENTEITIEEKVVVRKLNKKRLARVLIFLIVMLVVFSILLWSILNHQMWGIS